MDVKELRIGNYVIDNGEICEVIEIESNGMVMTTCKSKFPISNVEDLEPVKLNDNILLRSGFRLRGEFYRIRKFPDFSIPDLVYARSDIYFNSIAYIDTGDNRLITIATTRYVHELQNLFFAIADKELEINIANQVLFPET